MTVVACSEYDRLTLRGISPMRLIRTETKVPRLTSLHRGNTVLGHESVDSGGGDFVTRLKFHATGATLFIFVIISAGSSAAGLSLAVGGHVPIWATLLFLSILAIVIPVGSMIGYLFYVPRNHKADN